MQALTGWSNKWLQLPPNSSLQSIRGTVLAVVAVPQRWRSALLGAAEPHVRQVAPRVEVNQQPGRVAPRSTEATSSGSAFRRTIRFVFKHPIGVVQFIFFSLTAIVILQNLESTSIDVLFWSVPAFPKLALMFFSMLVGAAAWEVVRRLLRR
jgi:uncharacterized integral membrane protein